MAAICHAQTEPRRFGFLFNIKRIFILSTLASKKNKGHFFLSGSDAAFGRALPVKIVQLFGGQHFF